ncbi:MAG: tetratricopeptide repeat protein [Candidatus Zhuqueibacterota bacterium]
MFEKLLILLVAGAATLSHLIPSPTQMINMFEKGQKLFVIEDYAQAITRYEKILAIDSPFLKEKEVTTTLADMVISLPVAARYQMANCYKNLGDFERAIEHFKIVVQTAEIERLQAMAQSQIVLTRYNQKEYQATIEEARFLLDHFGNSEYAERALYNIGWSNYESGQYAESIAAFEEGIRRFPQGEYAVRSQYQIGESYFELKQFQSAVDAYNKLIENYIPKSFSERQWSEMELSRLKRRTQVESGIGKSREEHHIIELSAKAVIRIGDAYDQMQSADKSIEAYLRVPQDYLPMTDLVETAYIKAADVALRYKGLADAVQVYKNAIDASTDRVFQGKMKYQIAKVHFQHKDYAQAAAEYKSYIKAYRDVSQQVEFTVDAAYYQIGMAFYENFSYDSSLVFYQVVIDSFPNSHMRPNAYYGKGLVLQRAGQFDAAIAAMNELITAYPENQQTPLAYLQIARIHFDRKDYAQAISAFLSLLQNAKDGDVIDKNSIHFELGQCYRDSKQPDQAIAAFNNVEKGSDYFAVANSEISELYLQQGNFEQAEQVLRQVLDATTEPGKQAEVHYYLARLYVSAEQFEKAIPEFDLAIQGLQKPEILQSALFGRGAIQMQTVQYTSAIADFERLLAMPLVLPELKSKAMRRLVTCYLKSGDPQKSLESAHSFVDNAKSKSDRTDGLLALAQAHFELAQYEDGIRVADEIIATAEDEEHLVQAYFLKGNCYLNLKQFSQGTDAYQTALNKFPNSAFIPEVAFQLGVAYYNSEDFEKAAATFSGVTQRVSSGENRLFALYYRGFCLMRLGQWSDARSAFGTIVAEFPRRNEAAESAYQIAESYFNERNYEQAIEAYNDVKRKFPESRYAALSMYNSGWGYIQNNQQDQGIEVFKQLITAYPDSAYAIDALFTIGDWHYNNKRYDDATKTYQQLIERYPDSELAEKARGHVDELAQIHSYNEYEKASILFDEKKYPEAIVAFESVIAKFPEADVAVGARVNIAASHEMLKEWKKALQMYEYIIQTYKDDPAHHDAYAFAKEHYDWIMENR